MTPETWSYPGAPVTLSIGFDKLTPAQREAVRWVEGPLLILAGPGSGKTRVMTQRVAHLLELGVSPRAILALTFTNKAAEEMRERVDALVGPTPVWISTFHRFCARTLREHASLAGLEPNYTIYDTQDSQRALKRTLEELELDTLHYGVDQIASGISWAKNNLIGPASYEARRGSTLGAIVKAVYPAYQARLRQSNAVDFDDLLFHMATMLRESEEVRRELDERYQYIMVDEYQDTNFAQYALVRAMSIDAPNLAVCGDPDQSIYGWRGANLNNILDFERDYPKVHVVRLERNYRSTKAILRVADRLIRHNVRRKAKELFTENAEGVPVRLTAYATQATEAEAIVGRIAAEWRAGRRPARDFAIFLRTNALSRWFEESFRHAGIPFKLVNGVEFYQRREVKDLVAYLQLLNNPRDDNAFLRVINTPPRGIGATSLERLAAHARRYDQTLLEAARESGLAEGLTKRAAVSIVRFVAMYDRLSLLTGGPVEEILGNVLAESGYRRQFENSELDEDQSRLENIDELLSAARQFDEENAGTGRLEEFLETASLVNDTDELTAGDSVTLMTLHAAKGLEFPVVFIPAIEQGLIPHERSRDNPDQLEEERRLLFVGITRAREELHLSHARSRDYRGSRLLTVPSEFLMELPRDEMELNDEARRAAAWAEELVHVPTAPADDVQWAPQADDEKTSRGPRSAPGDPALAAAAALQTGAELGGAKRRSGPGISPEVFRQNMRVVHPEYGAGVIVALGGTSALRSATVKFDRQELPKKFVLSKCDLRPM